MRRAHQQPERDGQRSRPAAPTMPAARLVIQKACSAIRTGSWSAWPRSRRTTVVSSDEVDVSPSVVVASSSWSTWRRSWSSSPIEPSKATTPQARTKAASVAATTRWRISRTRRARAASSSAGRRGRGGHAASSGRSPRAPVRTLRGSWAMTTTVIFDLDGVLVDSRAVFLVLRATTRSPSSGCPQRTDEELLPYIGPPFAYALRRAAAACRTTRRSSPPASTATASATRTASLTETTVEPGIPEALAALARPPARGRDLQAARLRRAAAGRDGPARALRGRRRPGARPPRRGQDARRSAARSTRSARRAR